MLKGQGLGFRISWRGWGLGVADLGAVQGITVSGIRSSAGSGV